MDIENDILKNGRSLIMDKIIEEKRIDGCDCATKNPKGRWCLPDVHRVVDEVLGQNIDKSNFPKGRK